MDLFGERLRQVREQKQYTIEQVAHDTRISRKYIIALENEDFSIFPGETYLIGFLKSYASYLDLNPDEFVSIYKNFKIQEQPIPIRELLDIGRKVSPLLVVILIIIGFGIIGTGVYFLYTYVINKSPSDSVVEEPEPTVREPLNEYLFKNEVLTNWFPLGSIIKVPLSDAQEYTIKIFSAMDDVFLRISDKIIVIPKGRESFIDLNQDNKYDLKLIFNDVKIVETVKKVNLGLYKLSNLSIAELEETNSAAEGEILNKGDSIEESDSELVADDSESEENILPTSEPPTATPPPEETETIAVVETETITEEPTEVPEATQTEVVEAIPMSINAIDKSRVVVIESNSPESFTLNITFRGHCYFRYLLDNQRGDQRFFLKNDPLPLEIMNEAILWISNAGSIRAQIFGKNVIMGRAGQIVTKKIKWTKDDTSGKYLLEVISITD